MCSLAITLDKYNCAFDIHLVSIWCTKLLNNKYPVKVSPIFTTVCTNLEWKLYNLNMLKTVTFNVHILIFEFTCLQTGLDYVTSDPGLFLHHLAALY